MPTIVTTRPYNTQRDATELLALYERYVAEVGAYGPAGFDPNDPW